MSRVLERIRVPSRRFPAADGLRAVAAGGVFVFHLAYLTGHSQGAGSSLFDHLDVGVPIFFTISGLVLYLPFAKAHLEDRTHPPVRRFYLNRMLRIFPAYWVALTLVGVFLDHTLFEHGAVAALRSYLLLHTLSTRYFALGMGQAWSLTVELCFYLLLPVYALAIGALGRRRPVRNLGIELAGVSALVVGGVLYAAGLAVFSPSWRNLGAFWFPWYLPCFGFGMFFAVVVAALDGRRLPRVERRLGWLAAAAWPLAAIAFLLAARITPFQYPATALAPGRMLAREVLYTAVGALLVLPVAFPARSPRVVGTVLTNRVMRWLGLISYSFYLWHAAILGKVPVWTDRGVWRGGMVTTGVIAFGLTVCVATLSYVLVERTAVLRRPSVGAAPTSPGMHAARDGADGARSTTPAAGAPGAGAPFGPHTSSDAQIGFVRKNP